MSVYAQIQDGKIVSVFPGPQDEADWPGIVEMSEDDPRLIDHNAERDAAMTAAREGNGS